MGDGAYKRLGFQECCRIDLYTSKLLDKLLSMFACGSDWIGRSQFELVLFVYPLVRPVEFEPLTLLFFCVCLFSGRNGI